MVEGGSTPCRRVPGSTRRSRRPARPSGASRAWPATDPGRRGVAPLPIVELKSFAREVRGDKMASDQSIDLCGARVLVTGGTSGLGLAMASALTRVGATVVLALLH
jgi:hypothetical protein